MATTESSFIESSFVQSDTTYELPLRPQSLSDFVGQELVCERLHVLVQAARQRQEPLAHCIFSGPPGLGKTTLANILSKAMGSNLVTTSGPAIEKAGDLAGVLTNLQEGDILFIDEIHRLNRAVEEYLYSAMEDFFLDIMIDSGANARTVSIPIKKFTLAGATTRMGLISAPMRTRFGFSARLDYYSSEALEKILQRSSCILNVQTDHPSCQEIAKRARGTPRIANNLLRWVRDYAQVKNSGKITLSIAKSALDMLAIDERGLDEMDKKVLETIIDLYEGGPVGITTLALAVGEEASNLEEVYEPFLIMQGLIKRTPRGRVATPLAYSHLGKK